jgi:hypothetical protein
VLWASAEKIRKERNMTAKNIGNNLEDKVIPKDEYYIKQIEKYSLVKKDAYRQKILFLQSILLVSVSIVGIVISLHTTNTQFLYIRLVFLLSILLLSLGIVCLVLVLHDFSTLEDKLAQKFHDEILESMKMEVRCDAVYVDLKKTTSILEKCSYIFLLLGFILLITYSCLAEFRQDETIKTIEKKIEKLSAKVDSLTTKQKIYNTTNNQAPSP